MPCALASEVAMTSMARSAARRGSAWPWSARGHRDRRRDRADVGEAQADDPPAQDLVPLAPVDVVEVVAHEIADDPGGTGAEVFFPAEPAHPRHVAFLAEVADADQREGGAPPRSSVCFTVGFAIKPARSVASGT